MHTIEVTHGKKGSGEHERIIVETIYGCSQLECKEDDLLPFFRRTASFANGAIYMKFNGE